MENLAHLAPIKGAWDFLLVALAGGFRWPGLLLVAKEEVGKPGSPGPT